MIKTILIISPESWQAHAVSKHHYAMTLTAQGFSVLFLGPPSAGSQLAIEPAPGHPGLFIVQAPAVGRGLRFYPGFVRRRLEAAWLRRLELAFGARVDMVWLFENSRFYDMGFASNRLKIYHQVDLNQNSHPATAARTADVCFCTSDGILARLLPHNPRTHKIHHGTAVPAQPLALSTAQNASLQSGGPNAVYIGNLDILYIDAELLAAATQAHPAVRFHFVGGYSPQGQLRKLAAHLPNVVWWGKVPSPLIPTILARADVVLCAYKAAQYAEQLASPHKFMEYLASGRTIVATYTDEYKDQRHLLEMVDDNAGYLAAFSRVVGDLDEYNSPHRQAERKAFAEAHSYSKQLDRIFSLLQQRNLLTA